MPSKWIVRLKCYCNLQERLKPCGINRQWDMVSTRGRRIHWCYQLRGLIMCRNWSCCFQVDLRTCLSWRWSWIQLWRRSCQLVCVAILRTRYFVDCMFKCCRLSFAFMNVLEFRWKIIRTLSVLMTKKETKNTHSQQNDCSNSDPYSSFDSRTEACLYFGSICRRRLWSRRHCWALWIR